VSASADIQISEPAQPGSVAVVTDSTTYLPPQLIERWLIHEVSLYVGWDGDLRPEHEYADLDAFYARLRDSPRLPTTSQPSVGDFLERFQPLTGEGRDVVSIHLASGLSGTCESARESLDIWFCLDTLEYLRRGGRIGAAQAMVGTALKVKPILTFGTEIAPVGRVRTQRRALERMVDYLRELHDRGATDWIVQHAQAPENARRLVAEGTAIFGTDPLFCTEVGPVLGAHLGSGMLVGGMTRQPISGLSAGA
jgi:fatty acid-binding protein DegV